MIFAFLVSFLSFVHVNVGGELYLSELLFAAYLFLSIHRLRLLFVDAFPRNILMLGGLWLLSQVVTDIIRETPPENYLRGWAAIIFFLIDFCAVYLIVRRNPDLIRVIILGGALGAILSVIVLPTDYSTVEPWKFGYGLPVTMLVLLFLSTGKKYKSKSSLILLAALGVLSVFMNARSMGGMTLLTALMIYFGQGPAFGKYAAKPRGPAALVGTAVGILVAVFGIMLVYQWVAESGYLPEKVTEKYLMGKTQYTGPLGVVLGGRPEILISSQAVMDSPLIGHGSWPENPKYTNMRYAVVAQLGVDVDEAALKHGVEKSDLIPVHSVIMQAWVWAGLLGAVFWLYVLRYLVRNTFASFFVAQPIQPLVIFVGIYSIWNVLFSPFGAGQRISWAVTLMLIYIVATTIAKRHERLATSES